MPDLAALLVAPQTAVVDQSVEQAADAAGHTHGAHRNGRPEQRHQVAAQETADTATCRQTHRQGPISAAHTATCRQTHRQGPISAAHTAACSQADKSDTHQSNISSIVVFLLNEYLIFF